MHTYIDTEVIFHRTVAYKAIDIKYAYVDINIHRYISAHVRKYT